MSAEGRSAPVAARGRHNCLNPRASSPAGRGLIAALRHQWLVSGSIVFLLILVLCALFGPAVLGKEAINQQLQNRLLPPFNLRHGFLGILGTNALGQSELSQLIVGAQLTFVVVLAAVAIAVIVGFTLGMVSAYFGGWVDAVVMRIADILMTIPSLLLALAVLFLYEGSVIVLILVLSVTCIPIMIRVTRAQGLEVRQRTFIEAARSMGARPLDIIFRQMATVILPTVMTVALLEVSVVMLGVAGLSFLGVGLQPPAVAWGIMVADGQQFLTQAWWLTVFPGGLITLTAVALLLISNYLRAAADPQQALSLRSAALTKSRQGVRADEPKGN